MVANPSTEWSATKMARATATSIIPALQLLHQVVDFCRDVLDRIFAA